MYGCILSFLLLSRRGRATTVKKCTKKARYLFNSWYRSRWRRRRCCLTSLVKVEKALWVWFLFVCLFFNLRAYGSRIHFDETLKQVLAFGVVFDRI